VNDLLREQVDKDLIVSFIFCLIPVFRFLIELFFVFMSS